jgi:hypothetical protein
MFDENIVTSLAKRGPEQKTTGKFLLPKTSHHKTDAKKYEDYGDDIRPDQERLPDKSDTNHYQNDANEEPDPMTTG